MSDTVTTAIITGLCTAVPVLVASYFNRYRVASKIDGLHVQINSRLDQLIEAKENIAHAKGVSDQKRISESE